MRCEYWESKLSDHIQQSAQKEFKWGEFDCLFFAADWCKILTGIDPMSDKIEGDPEDIETVRGLYNSEKRAFELILFFRSTIENIFDAHFKRKPLLRANRGDIVLRDNCFGVVLDKGKVAFKTENKGLLIIPLKACEIAWGIE